MRGAPLRESCVSVPGFWHRYLYCPLVEAERAWAYAMQLKAEANSEPRKRFHMICRLRKAVQHTATLAALGDSDNCDALTKLEVQVSGDYFGYLGINT